MIDGIVSAPDGSASKVTNTSKIFAATNTTTAVPIFGITGDVRILRLWGVVTTAIGVNHTAAYFRLNDQTAQVAITAAAGTTLSALPAGSKIVKTALAAVAVTATSSAVGAIAEPAAAGSLIASEFAALKKAGAVTNIEYVYSTTDSPTTGAIQFFCEWQPRSADGNVTPQ